MKEPQLNVGSKQTISLKKRSSSLRVSTFLSSNLGFLLWARLWTMRKSYQSIRHWLFSYSKWWSEELTATKALVLRSTLQHALKATIQSTSPKNHQRIAASSVTTMSFTIMSACNSSTRSWPRSKWNHSASTTASSCVACVRVKKSNGSVSMTNSIFVIIVGQLSMRANTNSKKKRFHATTQGQRSYATTSELSTNIDPKTLVPA